MKHIDRETFDERHEEMINHWTWGGTPVKSVKIVQSRNDFMHAVVTYLDGTEVEFVVT